MMDTRSNARAELLGMSLATLVRSLTLNSTMSYKITCKICLMKKTKKKIQAGQKPP